MQPDYVHVCLRHRLEYSNAPQEKNKAFCDELLYEKSNSVSILNGTCMLLAQKKALHLGMFLTPIISVHRVCILHWLDHCIMVCISY